MTDTAIKNAISQRADLERQIEAHEKAIKDAKLELERVKAFMRAWLEFADEEEKQALGPIELDTVKNVQVKLHQGRKVANPKKEDVAEAAIRIILKVGRPLNRTELFDALKDEGMVILGKDPEMVLSTMLWRMKEKVVRIQPHGYWPADRPCEQAGYHPSEGESGELPGIRVRRRVMAEKSTRS